MERRRTQVLGCPVDALTMDETVERVRAIVAAGRPRHHVAINAAKVTRMAREPDLGDVVRRAAILSADGAAVVYASRLLGNPVPERVTGIDLMAELLRRAPAYGWRPYFLGGRAVAVRRAVERCQVLYPGLELAGFRDGHFPPTAEAQIAADIRDSGADLLFVGMRSPRQEGFIGRFLDEMGVPFSMGVGGSFDVLAGDLLRAPRWMRDNGLEWAWRTAQEPSRLLHRRTGDMAVFALRVLRARLRTSRLAAQSPPAELGSRVRVPPSPLPSPRT